MAGSIDNLYLKYCGRVQRYMENDPYYQYLLELIAGGKNVITQYNRVLDKKVDEKWLVAIEDTLPAIHEIISHPRRFLKTVENILPVEQVKKVGADTVRHLASHTQFISGVQEDGTLYPGKLLTVQNDESIDLYENRFVNTLIRKLAEFIEKRVGAIFWDTGNEECSILRMESNVEDDYESVEYKLEMTVKNKQTYLENDSGKMEIFKRIDRVRRMIADFRASTFCQVMNGTAIVRSPIQRTNQLIKNPDYRKCYDLWQFLERYDDVGYEIDVRETALDFDEDYLFQLYGNLALNYTVFKSLLEKDTRRITEPPKRHKSMKPKFVKQIVEEFVDNYDIPDVEIRRVIVEEVTKAQLEIERRTREKEQERLAREKAQKALEAQKEKERLALLRQKELEKARKEREAAKEKEQREKEREKARKAKEAEREKERKAREAEKEKERKALLRQKALEKERKEREAAKEKERLAKQKEREHEQARKAKEAQKEKERKALLRQKELEKARKEREAAKEKERLAKEKELGTARAKKSQGKSKSTTAVTEGSTGGSQNSAEQAMSIPEPVASVVVPEEAALPSNPATGAAGGDEAQGTRRPSVKRPAASGWNQPRQQWSGSLKRRQ